MKESLHSYMRVGIVNFMAFPETMRGEGPIFEAAKKIAEDDFFGAIEITTIKDTMTKGRVASLLATSGLAVGYGAQPVLMSNKLDLNSLIQAERRKAVDAVRLCIDEAAVLGAGAIAVLSGKDPGPEARDEASGLLVDSLTELAGYAGEKGMKFMLETFDRTIEKRCLIGPSVEAVKVAEKVRAKCPNFGLMADLSHVPQIGETSEESLTTMAPYITHIHIGNCILKEPSHPAYGDAHPRFGVPGSENGVPEIADFLRCLFKIGYLGGDKKELPIVSFEVKPMPGEVSEAVIANAKRYLLQAWSLV